MTENEVLDLLDKVQYDKSESNVLEVKSAHGGCPKRLYDTLSSFSNQDDGGIILFGVDEACDFKPVGVYDAQDLQRRVIEQCNQMEPPVRPLMSVATRAGMTFVTAEVPSIDVADRPCFYKGAGRLKGSYVRVGDQDQPMTEYEVYSYEAYRKKYEDDIRPVSRVTLSDLDQEALQSYIDVVKAGRPNFSTFDDEKVLELMGIMRDGSVTLSGLILFSPYPQAYFPQLCIRAMSLPGEYLAELGPLGERFTDNERIEGPIRALLNQSLQFIKRNMGIKTVINVRNGQREDRTDYPIIAIREALLNALVHRDYSVHTEGMPIQIIMYPSRLEIVNPGGLYGRIRIDQLGKVQADTRNPVLARAMEDLKLTENRYSGIPTMRKLMKECNQTEPEFTDRGGAFTVTLMKQQPLELEAVFSRSLSTEVLADRILEFCKEYRSRQEIAEFLGMKSTSYAVKTYVQPLVDRGLIVLMYPDKPRSSMQRFKTKENI